MYHIFCIHPLVERHLGCFQFLAIMNKAAIDIVEQGGKKGFGFTLSKVVSHGSMGGGKACGGRGGGRAWSRGRACLHGGILSSFHICSTWALPIAWCHPHSWWLCLTDRLGDSQSSLVGNEGWSSQEGVLGLGV